MSTPPLPGPTGTGPSSYGLFLAFEGGDGAGKTTQIARLAERLRSRGREVLVTREPGGSPLGVSIRELLLHGDHVSPRAEALLFAADRAHHVDFVVRPALARDAAVLTDRYLDSSVAYQGAGRDLAADDVRSLSLWAVQGLLPALTVLLDVSAQTGRERRGEVHDRLESEPDDFHARVREGFLALAAAEPQRYLVVDAARPVEEIADLVWQAVEPLLAAGRAAPQGAV